MSAEDLTVTPRTSRNYFGNNHSHVRRPLSEPPHSVGKITAERLEVEYQLDTQFLSQFLHLRQIPQKE